MICFWKNGGAYVSNMLLVPKLHQGDSLYYIFRHLVKFLIAFLAAKQYNDLTIDIDHGKSADIFTGILINTSTFLL